MDIRTIRKIRTTAMHQPIGSGARLQSVLTFREKPHEVSQCYLITFPEGMTAGDVRDRIDREKRNIAAMGYRMTGEELRVMVRDAGGPGFHPLGL